MRVVLTGGGTGGHIAPFEPIIEALRLAHAEEQKTLPDYIDPARIDISFLGVVTDQARTLFSNYDVPYTHIPSGKLRRYFSLQTIPDLFVKLPLGFLKALFHLWKIMPDVVISKGGYGSIPVVLAASFYRIPIVLHESDTVPGMTNEKLIRLASAVTVGFPSARDYLKKWEHKVFVTGTPVAQRLATIPKSEARRIFDIPLEEKVLLVMGGSQGAEQINEALLKALPTLIQKTTIIHSTGEDHFKTVSTVAEELIVASPRKHLYKAYPRLTDTMAAAFVAADAVVSRAGASSLAEIAQMRLPALLIPLATAANDHQRKNAHEFERAGAALVLDPTNAGEHLFRKNIERLLEDEELQKALISNTALLDYPKAAQDIAHLALKLASGLLPTKHQVLDSKA